MAKKNIEQYENEVVEAVLEMAAPAPELAYQCFVEVVAVIDGKRRVWFQQIRRPADWQELAAEIDQAATENLPGRKKA